MSGMVLLDAATSINTLEEGIAKDLNVFSNNLLVVVFGIGATFTATVDIYPVFHGNNIFPSDKISLTISNTTPNNSMIITTPHRKFIAVLSSLTGSASITALIEG